jgi:hypothetical protein
MNKSVALTERKRHVTVWTGGCNRKGSPLDLAAIQKKDLKFVEESVRKMQ